MKRIFELAKANSLFKDSYFKHYEKDFMKLIQEGQKPTILLISCSDSRVVPHLITGSKPGDMFEVRNIGNFVPPYSPDDDYHATATGIEFAVNVLGVTDIIVCGHSHCGACEFLYKEITDPNLVHTRKWLELGARARAAAIVALPDDTEMEQRLRVTEKVSVVFQLENLMTYPYIAERQEKGQLHLHGWYYRLDTGELEYFSPEAMNFVPFDEMDQKSMTAKSTKP